MKRFLKHGTTLLTTIAATAAIGTASASAAPVKTISAKFSGSYASASSYASDSCSDSYTYVGGYQQADRYTGTKMTRGTTIYVYTGSYNWCTGVWNESSGYVDADSRTNLKSIKSGARLVGTVQTTSYSFDSSDSSASAPAAGPSFAIDLTLTPTGKPAVYRDASNSKTAFGHFISRWSGWDSSAAVSGSLKVNGIAANLSTFTGSIGTSSGGYVQFGDPMAVPPCI